MWDFSPSEAPTRADIKAARSFRAVNSRCVVKLRADIHEQLHLLQPKTRSIIPAMFGSLRVKAGSTVHYKVTGKINQFAFGEIVRTGEPAFGDEPLGLKRGTIVGFDLGQVAHQLKTGHVLLQWAALLCTLDPDAEYPVPLGDHLMVRQNEEALDRMSFSASKLVAPRLGPDGVVNTGDNARSRVGARCDEVISSGPGKRVKGKLLPNGGCIPGDWIIYTPSTAVDLLFRRAEMLRFVPWDKVEGVITERDPYGQG
jgi:hypothetical protein